MLFHLPNLYQHNILAQKFLSQEITGVKKYWIKSSLLNRIKKFTNLPVYRQIIINKVRYQKYKNEKYDKKKQLYQKYNKNKNKNYVSFYHNNFQKNKSSYLNTGALKKEVKPAPVLGIFSLIKQEEAKKKRTNTKKQFASIKKLCITHFWKKPN